MKQIDTLAAEYPAETNYLYMTYRAGAAISRLRERESWFPEGPLQNRLERRFDWCCVNAIQTSRNLGRRTIMVNCNPET